MNPIAFLRRRPFLMVILLIAMVAGGTVGLTKMSANDLSTRGNSRFFAYLGGVSAKVQQLKGHITEQLQSDNDDQDDDDQDDDDHDDDDQEDDDHEDNDDHDEKSEDAHEAEQERIVVTNPVLKNVTLTEQYVCQIHSQRHIEICALESGFLEEILVREGQRVKKGDLMFRILPTLYQARLDAENAEAQLAQLEYNNTRRLFEQNVVSQNEVALVQAKLAKAQAQAKLAAAELNFTYVRAPFDGIADRLQKQLGSLIAEGDVLTTLSDNSLMWVYFNVPEARYLEYMARSEKEKANQEIELVLADGRIFPQHGTIGAIEAKFNNETGNIPFRADFPNPDRLLRHGQTGTIRVKKVVGHALIIPQRSTFEILDRRYVFVVGKDHVVRQREIMVQNELDDIFVIGKGLDVNDRIILEGVRQVRDGDTVECEFESPDVVLAGLKYAAE